MRRRQTISRAAQKALEEFSSREGFAQSQIKIRESLVEFEHQHPEDTRRTGTPEQLELALELFDIQAINYLGFIKDVDSQKLYMTVLENCEYGAWDFYIGMNGTEFELAGIFPIQMRRIEDRKLHWINEGWKQVAEKSESAIEQDLNTLRGGAEDVRARRQAYVLPKLADKGMSKSKWAAKAGVDPSVVYDYLAGESSPRPDSRKALAEVLEVESSDLPD